MNTKALLAAFGFFAFWALFGIIQEKVFKTQHFALPMVATMLHQLVLTVCSYFYLAIENNNNKKFSLPTKISDKKSKQR
jgi:hypothetical protein